MQKIRILLIEDDEFLRDLYVDILSSEGYKIETAIDGQEGYEKIKKGDWNLILLDVILPKLNAFEMLKKLDTDDPSISKRPIVLLTNLEIDTTIQEILKNVKGYLIKSEYTPEQFIEQIRRYLS